MRALLKHAANKLAQQNNSSNRAAIPKTKWRRIYINGILPTHVQVMSSPFVLYTCIHLYITAYCHDIRYIRNINIVYMCVCVSYIPVRFFFLFQFQSQSVSFSLVVHVPAIVVKLSHLHLYTNSIILYTLKERKV